MGIGDRVAFGDYVRSRGGALLRAAQALTGNRADAEDLVQSTLVKTYQSWDSISDPAALDTYVRRVMINTHISGWRRRRVDEFPTDELPDEPAADQTVDSDLRELVQRALDRLPRRMRAAVMLRYYDDMSEPEVAAALGVSVGTVKSTVARAVAKLREDAELGADAEDAGAGTDSSALLKGYTAAVHMALSPSGHYLRRCGRGQHDDGHPADGHVDYAIRHDGVRGHGSRHMCGRGAAATADLRGRRRACGQVGERAAVPRRRRGPAGWHLHVEQRRAR